MMKRTEIIEKIIENDGEWNPTKTLTFTAKENDSGGVLITHKNGISAHLWGHLSDADQFHFIDSFFLKNFKEIADLARDLSHFLEIDIDGFETKTVVKEIEKPHDNSLEMQLKGKVEAYENILIGRAITAS